jgi:hypothetical protein
MAAGDQEKRACVDGVRAGDQDVPATLERTGQPHERALRTTSRRGRVGAADEHQSRWLPAGMRRAHFLAGRMGGFFRSRCTLGARVSVW